MEQFLLRVFNVIDRTFSRRLDKLEKKIKRNRNNFEEVKRLNHDLQERAFELYNMQEEEASASDQIGFMFRMAENDPQFESLDNFDISKVISEDTTLSKIENETSMAQPQNLMLNCSNMLVSESFRKKNPHEISSEQIFNEDISNIGFENSNQNNYLSVERKFEKQNPNVSNLKSNTSNFCKAKFEYDLSYNEEEANPEDLKFYNYSETDNTKYMSSDRSHQLFKLSEKEILNKFLPNEESNENSNNTSRSPISSTRKGPNTSLGTIATKKLSLNKLSPSSTLLRKSRDPALLANILNPKKNPVSKEDLTRNQPKSAVFESKPLDQASENALQNENLTQEPSTRGGAGLTDIEHDKNALQSAGGQSIHTIGHRRKNKSRAVNANSIDVIIKNKRKGDEKNFVDLKSLHTYKNSMLSSKTGKPRSDNHTDLIATDQGSSKLTGNDALQAELGPSLKRSFDFAMKRRAVERLRLKSDNTNANINLYKAEKVDEIEGDGKEKIAEFENEFGMKNDADKKSGFNDQKAVRTKNIRLKGYMGSLDKPPKDYFNKNNKQMRKMHHSGSNLQLLLQSRGLSLDMTDFDPAQLVNQTPRIEEPLTQSANQPHSFQPKQYMKRKTVCGTQGFLGPNGESEMKPKMLGHKHSKSNFQSVRPSDLKPFIQSTLMKDAALKSSLNFPNTQNITNRASDIKNIRNNYIKTINNINLQNWKPQNSSPIDPQLEAYGLSNLPNPKTGSPQNDRRRSLIGFRNKNKHDDEHKRSGLEPWKRRELRRSRTRLGIDELRRKSIHFDKLRGDGVFSQIFDQQLYPEHESSEERRKKKKKKKKVTKFDQRIYDKKELLESYRLHMKKNEDGKKDKRDKSEPKKVKVKKKKSRVAGKSKTKTKDIRIKEVGQKKELSDMIVKKSGKRSKSEIPNNKRNNLRGVSKNLKKKLKDVTPKIDTGLLSNIINPRKDSIQESRRVRKDFALEGIVLPTINLEIPKPVTQIESTENLDFRLDLQEPKENALRNLVMKVEEDRMEYISDLDVKEHVDVRLLMTLKEFGVILGGEFDSAMPSLSKNQIGHPSQAIDRPHNFFLERNIERPKKIYLDSQENLAKEKSLAHNQVGVMTFSKKPKNQSRPKRPKRKSQKPVKGKQKGNKLAKKKKAKKAHSKRAKSKNLGKPKKVHSRSNTEHSSFNHFSSRPDQKSRIFENDSEGSEENDSKQNSNFSNKGHSRIESIVLNVKSYHPQTDRRSSQKKLKGQVQKKRKSQSKTVQNLGDQHASKVSNRQSQLGNLDSSQVTQRNRNPKSKKSKKIYKLNLDKSAEKLKRYASPRAGRLKGHSKPKRQKQNQIRDNLTMSLTMQSGGLAHHPELANLKHHTRKNSKKPEINKKFQEDLDDSAYLSSTRSQNNFGLAEDATLNLYGSENLVGFEKSMLTRSELVTPVHRLQPNKKRRTKTPEQKQTKKKKKNRSNRSKQSKKKRKKSIRSKNPRQKNKLSKNNDEFLGIENHTQQNEDGKNNLVPNWVQSSDRVDLPNKYKSNQPARPKKKRKKKGSIKISKRSGTPNAQSALLKHSKPLLNIQQIQHLESLTGVKPQMVYIKKSDLVRRSNRSKNSSKGSSEGSHNLYRPPKIKKNIKNLKRDVPVGLGLFKSNPAPNRLISRKRKDSKRRETPKISYTGQDMGNVDNKNRKIRAMSKTGGSLQVNEMSKLKRKARSKNPNLRLEKPKYKNKASKKLKRSKKSNTHYDSNKLLYSSLQVNREHRESSIDIYSKIKQGQASQNRIELKKSSHEKSDNQLSGQKSNESDEFMFNLSKTDNSPMNKEHASFPENGQCLMFNFSANPQNIKNHGAYGNESQHLHKRFKKIENVKGKAYVGYSVDRRGDKKPGNLKREERRHTMGTVIDASLTSSLPGLREKKSNVNQVFGGDFESQQSHSHSKNNSSQFTHSGLSTPQNFSSSHNKKSNFENHPLTPSSFQKAPKSKIAEKNRLIPNPQIKTRLKQNLLHKSRMMSEEEPVRETNKTISSNEEYFGLSRGSRLLSKTADQFFPVKKSDRRKTDLNEDSSHHFTRKITEDSQDNSRAGSSSQRNDGSRGLRLNAGGLRRIKGSKEGLGKMLKRKITAHSRNKTLGQLAAEHKKKSSRRVESNFERSPEKNQSNTINHEKKNNNVDSKLRDSSQELSERHQLKKIKLKKTGSGPKLKTSSNLTPSLKLSMKLKGKNSPKYATHQLKRKPPKMGKLKSGLLKRNKNSSKLLGKGSPSLAKKLLPPIIKKKSVGSSKISLKSDSCQNHIQTKGSPLLKKQQLRKKYKSPSIKRKRSPLIGARFAGGNLGSRTARLGSLREKLSSQNQAPGEYEIEMKQSEIEKIFPVRADESQGRKSKIGSHRILGRGRYRSPNRVPLIGKKQKKVVRKSTMALTERNLVSKRKLVRKESREELSASSDDSNSSSDNNSSDDNSSSN